VNFNVAVGVAVPAAVTLATLPADVVEIVPQYRGYRYVVVEDRILIVEPERRTVVYVIDRGGRATTGSAAGSAGVGARISLTDDERLTVIRVVERRSTRLPSIDIAVGTRLPESVELVEFSDRVVTEVPKLRPYRYVVAQEQLLIVEPQDRSIVSVIEMR
jgi:hypothetical protein